MHSAGGLDRLGFGLWPWAFGLLSSPGIDTRLFWETRSKQLRTGCQQLEHPTPCCSMHDPGSSWSSSHWTGVGHTVRRPQHQHLQWACVGWLETAHPSQAKAMLDVV